MTRQNYSSGTHYESLAGYSRAVRVGNVIHVAGTTATGPNGLVGGNDAAAQADYVLSKIETALRALGGRMEDVVRTRVYVSDIANWEAVALVHGKWFAAIRPVNTLIEARLVGPEYLVEIEAEALLADSDDA